MIDFSFFTGNITSIYLGQKLDTREYEIIPDQFLEPAFFLENYKFLNCYPSERPFYMFCYRFRD